MQFTEPGVEHLEVLRRHFKFKSFKKEQWMLIRGLIYDKKDCCVIATTGFGKSLIYQYPPVFANKLAIVISPLCSLMQDQVLSLTSKNIKACLLGSAQPNKKLNMRNFNIVYITPEFLEHNLHKIEKVKDRVMLFAIDEAHLIDQWSDFRKSFTKLGVLRKTFPTIPIIALTATAPSYVQTVIKDTLQLKSDHIFIQTALDRPNIQFEVRNKRNFHVDIVPFLRGLKEGSAIVYCTSRKDTEKYSRILNKAGIISRAYHSLVKHDEKDQIVRDFKNNKLRFVVCTIAYGMGVDTPNVRMVLHYGPPKSIEAYFQEAGRAGRDGNPSKCVLFDAEGDYIPLYGFVDDSDCSEEKKTQIRALIDRFRSFLSSNKCRRYEVLEYLGASKEELAKLRIRENCCDNCTRAFNSLIPKNLLYYDINENGMYDFSNDARIVLKAVHRKLIRKEVVELLVGLLPTKSNFKYYKLEMFGVGKNKHEDWWSLTISLLVAKMYLLGVGNTLKLEEKAKSFLRLKNQTLFLAPISEMLKFLKKREGVEFYWEGNIIANRSTVNPEPEIIIPIDYDDDLLLEACVKAEVSYHALESEKDDNSDSDFEASFIQEVERVEMADKIGKNAGSSSSVCDEILQLEIERDSLNMKINRLKKAQEEESRKSLSKKREHADEDDPDSARKVRKA